MQQVYLNFWKDDYKSDFIIGDSNFAAKEILLNCNDNVLIKGPKFSGKKHLAYKASTINQKNIYFLDSMLDEEIISTFDKNIGVWIYGDVNSFSKDVFSRLGSMFVAEILELSPDMSFALLKSRLERVGLVLSSEMLSYILHYMPLKYEFIEKLVIELLSLKNINMSQLKKTLKHLC